jgi:site-specific recombinase XerD
MHIASLKLKLLACQSKIEFRGGAVTVQSLKNEYYGITAKPRMLIEIMQQHNDDIRSLIGSGYVMATWIKYNATLKHVKDFVQHKFNLADINIKLLNLEFITDYEFYLKTVKKINPATNPKYIKNLKKIILGCVAKDWLVKDPFTAYKLKIKKSERGFLTDLELNAIQQKDFDIPRLQIVKDIFLFSCYTGLAFVDICNLSKSNMIIGIDGEKWIFTHRQKTDTPSRIPLLPKALKLIEDYSLNPKAINQNCLFLVPSNQKVNAYLKEIAACCGINKELTFHMARHTFATTVTLNNGVPIESVSKMLGHTKIQTTQIYAKVLDKKVSGDMMLLRNKLDNKNPDDQNLKKIV